MGTLPLNGWWTEYEGYVFNDTNRNGVKDPGEKGVPNFTLTLRKRGQLADGPRPEHGHHRRQRPLLLRGRLPARRVDRPGGVQRLASTRPASPTRPTTSRPRRRSRARASTSACCRSSASAARWTGASTPTTRPARNGVDPRNGGIVGTVSYDTTRNELDPQYAAVRGLAAGRLRRPGRALRARRLRHGRSAPCDADDRYELAPDGSYAKGKLLNTYVTESWQRPTGCTARDVDGNPLVPRRRRERAGARTRRPTGECISSFMQEHPVRPLRHRPGHARRQLRRLGRRQLRLRRRLLRRDPRRRRPGDPACAGGDVHRARRPRTTWSQVDDPRRRLAATRCTR